MDDSSQMLSSGGDDEFDDTPDMNDPWQPSSKAETNGEEDAMEEAQPTQQPKKKKGKQ